MKSFRPRIFIGSSKEGLPIAEQVLSELSTVGDCVLWTTHFDFGDSAYEDLVKKLSLFDYGILVATADDVTVSRAVEKPSPRDNVIFEFGLFAGRLGRQRAFLLAESGIKVLSDLNGITLPFFPTSKAKGIFSYFKSSSHALDEQKKGVSKCCKAIQGHIEKRQNIFDFGFLPSTSLAFGYYSNFVLKAVTSLLESKKLRLANGPQNAKDSATATGIVDGMNFNDVRLTILIPDNLAANMFDQVKAHCSKNDWQMVKIDAGGFRPFDFYVQVAKSNSDILHLSDVPLTLNALNESIKAYVGKSYIGVSDAEQLLERRELDVFKKVLDYLIASNPITKDRVITELVGI
jgi:Predicted nucleotide-binding protein containing TIR-like domain